MRVCRKVCERRVKGPARGRAGVLLEGTADFPCVLETKVGGD